MNKSLRSIYKSLGSMCKRQRSIGLRFGNTIPANKKRKYKIHGITSLSPFRPSCARLERGFKLNIMSKKIDELITKAGIAANNSLQHPEMQPMLAEFGYTTERIGEGKTLLDAAAAQNAKHKKEYGEQFQATDELEIKTQKAYSPYVTFVKIARIALANEPASWTALGLTGNRKKSEAGLLAQFSLFYSNLRDNLQEWYSDFIAIARIALADKPQYLEILGIAKK